MTQGSVSTNESAFVRSELDAIPGMMPRARETLETLPFDRDTITTMVNSLIEDTNAIEDEPMLTWADLNDPILTNTRKIVPSGNVSLTVGASEAELDLTDTAVSAGNYGSATRLVVLGIDAKGRVTSATTAALTSGNVTETSKLFFTDVRARNALSGSSGIDYNAASGVIALDPVPGVAGTYASPTSITVNGFGQIVAIS